MVTKGYILDNLKQIERLYNSSSSIHQSSFYSKLAIIELCGWIEISMDDIVLRIATRKLRDAKNLDYIKKIVKRTYGFDYEHHFLPMLEAVIGRHGIKRMNARIDNGLVQPLFGALSLLKPARDQLAHNFIKGITPIIDAPSVTRTRFKVVYEGLRNIEKVLQKI